MPRLALAIAVSSLPALSADHLDFAYVLVQGQSQTMSGSSSDLREAAKLKSDVAEPYLWLRRAGKRYLVTDPALVEQADALAEPQRKLGHKQAELGTRQAELGRRQARLGREQGELGRAETRAALRGTDRDRDDDAARELRRQQHDLADEQRELGEAQGVMGREQAKIGREQARLAREAQEKMQALLDDAIARGLVRPLD